MPKKKPTASGNSKPTDSTMLSVRMSNDELDLIKRAAELRDLPTAAFIRGSARVAARETINALSERRHGRMIEEMARKIASQMIDGAVEIESTALGNDPNDGSMEMSTEFVTRSLYFDRHPSGESTTVRPVILDERESKILAEILTHAARPFAVAFSDAVRDAMAKDQPKGFGPIVEAEDG